MDKDKKTLYNGSHVKTSGMIGYIVGGHLIGLNDTDEIIIDFDIFNPNTEISIVEIVYSYMEASYSKYGFIDNTGKTVIPLKYDDADNFSEGIARVQLNGETRYIDKQGNEYATEEAAWAWEAVKDKEK
jgi:hypothetical protein